MKKISYLLCFLLAFFLFGVKANAAASLNVSTSNITVGGSFTVSVSMSNSAAWNIHVNASGPVSGCAINEVGDSGDLSNISRTFSATCTATGAGTITVSLSGDTSTMDSNYNISTSNLSGTRTVYAANPTPVTPSPSPSPSTSPTPTTPVTPASPSTPANPTTSDTRSANCDLKSLKVEGQELTKVSDTAYTLKVTNNVDKIVIKAEKADAKATVTGDGSKDLKVGENKFEVVVTAENGTKKTYTITVTRKSDSYTIEQIKDAIADANSVTVDLLIDKKDKLTSEDITLMKESAKNFNITKYDSSNRALYTWKIKGSELDGVKSLDLAVETSCEGDFGEDSYCFSVNDDKLPAGTTLKLYVGKKFKNGDSLRMSTTDDEIIIEDLTVDDGYVVIELENGGDYVLQLNEEEKEVVEEKAFPIDKKYLYIGGGVVVLLLLLLLLKKKGKKKDKVETNDNSNEPEMMNVGPTTIPEIVNEPVMTTTPVVTTEPEILNTPVTTPVTETTVPPIMTTVPPANTEITKGFH